jgi:hypothetical protein
LDLGPARELGEGRCAVGAGKFGGHAVLPCCGFAESLTREPANALLSFASYTVAFASLAAILRRNNAGLGDQALSPRSHFQDPL